MMYLVRGWYDEKSTGAITVETHKRIDALEKALDLKIQGVENVSVTDETGREFSPTEFKAFCADDDA